MARVVVGKARAGRAARATKAAARREPEETQVEEKRAMDVSDNTVGATKADMMVVRVVGDAEGAR